MQEIVPTTRPPRPDPRLALARAAWIAVAVPAYLLFFVNLPGYFAALQHARPPGVAWYTGQLTAADASMLQAWGVSLGVYATAMVIVSLLFQLSYAGMGLLIFLRRSDDWMALSSSFALLMFPFALANQTLQALPHEWAWLTLFLGVLGNGGLMFCAYLFPDGRFAPRGARWLALGVLGYWLISGLDPYWTLGSTWLDNAVFFGLIASTMLVQVYRYRYTSTPRQRLQTRWVVFGTAMALGGNLGIRLLFEFAVAPVMGNTTLRWALEVMLVQLAMLVLPPTIGIAILRSRLWDIDLFINRALVYTLLTTTLLLAYFSLVLALQALLQALIVPSTDLAVVGSTLAVAGLFQPLRERIQAAIDRRFYRRKYDGARTLAAFADRLRYEVDLTGLSDQLLAAVQETMQPAHVSLWLRSTAAERPPHGSGSRGAL